MTGRRVTGLRGRGLPFRVKLTGAYGGMFLAAGAGLVALIYILLRRLLPQNVAVALRTTAPAQTYPTRGPVVPASPMPGEPAQGGSIDASRTKVLAVVQDAALQQLLISSIIGLVVFALVAIALSWWLSGRVLRPVHTITATARRLSADNLHERIALKGPPDELKELADTFDEMLDRLEKVVGAQRRFVANAAHELRTPLTMQRAAAEIGLADPDPGKVGSVRANLLTVAERSERLIEGLLMLSTTDEGLGRRERVALDEIAETVLVEEAEAAGAAGVTLVPRIAPVTVDGDPVLLTHLVRNVVGNAVRYNEPGGEVRVEVDAGGLCVTNTGQEVPAELVPALFEPFRRLHPRRHAPGEGAGLGLSIVASIARAHEAEIDAEANPGGGLVVRVVFPPVGAAAPTGGATRQGS